MLFKPPKRHRPPAIIIVALVDVLLVVLIFMMVATTFKPPQQPALKLALPESTQTNTTATDTKRLVVTVDRQAPFLYLGDRPVTYERLREELQRSAQANPEITLSLRADDAAPFGQIVRVMDAARENGIQTVNAFTRTPGAAPGEATP
jgi:biopolymer transport protein TolR